MRLAIHDFGGYPFTGQLADELAQRGHDVHYLHGAGFRSPRGLHGRTQRPESLTIGGIDPGTGYRAGAGVRRLLFERRYGEALAARIADLRPDAVLSANTPLDAQAHALAATRSVEGSFVFWMQDVYSVAVRELLRRRLPVAWRAIAARFERLERRLARDADAVVAISEDFRSVLGGWGVQRERVHVIENWAPLEAPLTNDRSWATEHGVPARPILMYSGTLGRKHDPTSLIALARDVPSAEVVVVSEGAGADLLDRMSSLPPNFHRFPLQPYEELRRQLSSADVLIAILDAAAQEFSVPSKVLTYLEAGKPILAIMPSGNLASRTVAEAGAGIVVEPGDRGGAREAAQRLLSDDTTRNSAARNARRYAESNFDVAQKADLFEAILRTDTAGTRTRDPA